MRTATHLRARLSALLLTAALLFGLLPVAAQAADVNQILIDGAVYTARDVTGKVVLPFVKDGTTYLPVRAIGTAFGQDVSWDAATNTAYIGFQSANAPRTSDIKVYVNGSRLDPRDVNGKSVPPIARNGTIYLPIRAIGEAFDRQVSWDAATRNVILQSVNAYGPDLYRLIFTGDWSSLSNADQWKKEITSQFGIYAKLCARWGSTGQESHTVVVQADRSYSGSVSTDVSRGVVRVSTTYLDKHPKDAGLFTREFMRFTQSYGSFQTTWWTQQLAAYARFRYYSDVSYDKKDTLIRNWGWGNSPYAGCEWFYAYLDQKYPTTRNQNNEVQLGLLDSLHLAIKNGTITSDGGNSHTDANFNAVVKAITGYDTMEQLRQKYVKDLDAGDWTFNGFSGYADRFLTDNVSVTVDTKTASDNLLSGAKVLRWMGSVYEGHGPSCLVDGNLDTSFQPGFSDTARPYVILDLGSSRTIRSYSLLTNSYGTQALGNVGSWELLVSNDASTWEVADTRIGQTRGRISCDTKPVTGRYVMLRITGLGEGGYFPILYELMLFGSAGGASESVQTWTDDASTYTGVRRNGVIQGYGMERNASGTYVGNFENGQRQGNGTFYYSNGDIFSGQWFQDLKNGSGRYTWTNGTVQIAAWAAGIRDGLCWQIEPDGTVYRQTRSKDALVNSTAVSPETWSSGTVTYTGVRINGLLEGAGTRRDSSNGAVYKGLFTEGEPMGKGTLTWPNGDVFSGTWYPDGTRAGTFTKSGGSAVPYTWANGNWYAS